MSQKDKIVLKYTDHLLVEGRRPHSVYAFCKTLKMDESKFYEHFSRFEAIEAYVLEHFHHEVISLLEKSEDYDNGGAQTKLLSYYYTHMELLTNNRSLVLILLENKDLSHKISLLKKLRSNFLNFLDTIDLPSIDVKLDQLMDLQEQAKKEALWIHFVSILKFWLEDDSPSFTDTDQYIEKSSHLGYQLLNTGPFEQLLDFGKFLFKKKKVDLF